MVDKLRNDAMTIIQQSINEVLPEKAVIDALKSRSILGNVIVIAIGKAAWNMASAAKDLLGNKISCGLVGTKHGHSRGPIEGFEIIEAGHPTPDGNSELCAIKAFELIENAAEADEIIFLISGGGSSIFEKPVDGVTMEEIIDITDQLLACGADIVEINTIRKRLSAVKGGKFAKACYPKKIFSVVLSDVIGNRLDSIASGPTCPDFSTSKEAINIINKYGLKADKKILDNMNIETPKEIINTEIVVTGSVESLCKAAQNVAKALGYETQIVTTSLDCEAKEAGKFIASIARDAKVYENTKPQAWIFGGETVVKIVGKGKGGRNQELALSAAIGIEGIGDVIISSVGSDGTDGPTDAAGGLVDGETVERIRNASLSPKKLLRNNDSYHALKASNDLVITGSTGTNVNDLILILIGK